MSESKWKDYFNKKASIHEGSVMTSDYFNEKSFYTQRNNTLKWLGELKNCEILDAGCGVGAFCETLVKDNTVYGVDFSEKSLVYAKKRGLNTHCGDLTSMPFNDGKFDVTICIGVIQLASEYEKIIKEMVRVTKPGGVVLAETLNGNSILRNLYLKVSKEKNFDHMFSKLELKRIFEKYGLTNTEFMNVYYPTSFVSYKKEESFLDKYFGTSFAVKGVKK